MKLPARAKLIEQLKLIAAVANGGPVVLDDFNFIDIPRAMSLTGFALFTEAAKTIWFMNEGGSYIDTIGLFGLADIRKWETFETLADAIIAERKRLDKVARN